MTTLTITLVLLLGACGGKTSNPEGTAAGECSDGADNDADGLFDCDDPDCASSSDCATTDGGTTDGGTADGGTPDGGTPDGGGPDAGTPDGGGPDGGAPDGGGPDGGGPDGGGPDAGTTDGGGPDGGGPDGGGPDGGAPDGGAPDGGTSDTGGTSATIVTIEGDMTVSGRVPASGATCLVVAWSGTDPTTDTLYGASTFTCPSAVGTATPFSVDIDLAGASEVYLGGSVDEGKGSITEDWAVANPYTTGSTGTVSGVAINISLR